MVTLTAVDDVRAARLRLAVVRAAVALVAVPHHWRGGWSLVIARSWRRAVSQYMTHIVPHFSHSLYQSVAVACTTRRSRADDYSDVSAVKCTWWQISDKWRLKCQCND